MSLHFRCFQQLFRHIFMPCFDKLSPMHLHIEWEAWRLEMKVVQTPFLGSKD
jgi:hypothetical protein